MNREPRPNIEHMVAHVMASGDRQQLLVDAAKNIRDFQLIMDQVLPQAGRLVLDIGLLNDTMVESGRLLRDIDKAVQS